MPVMELNQDLRGTTSHTAPMRTSLLSKLAGSDSEPENNVPVRKAGGGLLSRLRAESEDSESDEEEANKMIERAKQRIMATKPIEPASSEDEDSDNNGDAYERMKKMLMADPSQKDAQIQQAKQQNRNAHGISSSEDEDDAPVIARRARRVQSKRDPTVSPKRTAALPSSRRSSPGLFVTPDASPASNRVSQVSTPNDDTRPTRNADFQERVERIRAERLAAQKQKQEKQKKARQVRHEEDEESDHKKSDGEDGRRLTQATKPARKAGKKALEAMAREQQRIERSMQLTHQAKTKKKYGMKDLFAKFGYPQGIEGDTASLPTPDLSSQPASPRAEDGHKDDTPPTSPPSMGDFQQMDLVMTEEPLVAPKVDKGKGRAPEFAHLPPKDAIVAATTVTRQQALASKKPATTDLVELSDSDEDTKVAQPKSRFAVFDKIPEKKRREAPSLLHLRHLAGLTSPSKNQSKGPKSMNFAQLGASLHLKARQQAQKERAEKIEDLRRRGIHVETEEEREKRQMEIEDMVAQFEKQRQEDLALAKLERKEAKANGEAGDGLISSDESDDDYVGSGDENAADDDGEGDNEEEMELELSGTEEEEDAEAEKDEELDDEAAEPNALIDGMADEDEGEEAEEAPEQPHDLGEVENDEVQAPVRKRAAHRARHVVVDEDDDDDDAAPENGPPTQAATQDDAMAAFGFGNALQAVGLTQAFAGTMAELESVSQNATVPPLREEQDSLDFLRNLPATQPDAVFAHANGFLVPNSQGVASPPPDLQGEVSAQFSMGVSQFVNAIDFSRPEFSSTQLSEVPEPTQDAGFLMSRSPAGVQAPPSTVDTVMMEVAESPVVQRKGKLRRGRAAPEELSDIDHDNVFSGSEDGDAPRRPTKAKDVFNVMKKAAKKQKKADDFNKKTSWARDVVEEQAEESEDEYAGIGGASDDDSDNEADEELANMIDTSDVKVDERQLAAFYADKTRKEDEKNINQLYKDFKSGNWRKRAAGRADFELSDSEDEAEMRRRKRQREFQQSTRALLQDERIGKIADNAKKTAFFKTLVDHYDDADYDFLNMEEPLNETSQSQSDVAPENNENVSVPDSQALDTSNAPVNPLKRKATESQEKENRPPPHMRRTAATDGLTRKPMSMADIEHSVSELLEDPRVVVPDSQYLSDSDDDLEVGLPTHQEKPAKPVIVDRLTLSRTSTSSTTTTSTTADSHLAFHAPAAGSHAPGFRVPSLVRRATSNFSTVSERSAGSGTNTPTETTVRRGGTGRSNIHAQAREAERRAVMEKAESKRKEALKKKAGKARAQRSVLSLLGGGFE